MHQLPDIGRIGALTVGTIKIGKFKFEGTTGSEAVFFLSESICAPWSLKISNTAKWIWYHWSIKFIKKFFFFLIETKFLNGLLMDFYVYFFNGCQSCCQKFFFKYIVKISIAFQNARICKKIVHVELRNDWSRNFHYLSV